MNPTFAAWRKNPIIHLLSSVRFGVGMMVIILVYACIASALPQVRGALEMTEMQIFRHWTFSGLIVLFGLSVTLATLTRIKICWVNAGVLTVHTGLLLLVIGSIVYFAAKIEGDTLLISPKIQLISAGGGQQRVIGEVLAEKGQEWSNFMPAFGGAVRMSIGDVAVDTNGVIMAASISAEAGGETRTFTLDRGSDGELIPGRLIAHLETSGPVETFFDHEVAALYVRQTGATEAAMLPINGLPYFRERYLEEGGVIMDAAGRPVPSKRVAPRIQTAGVNLPTHWLEHWRLPIDVENGGLPFEVKVTGYLPYIARLVGTAVEGGDTLNPVAQVHLSVADTSIEESLVALSPARSMMSRGIPVEFIWVESEAAMKAAMRPLVGPHELQIELKDPPYSKTVPIVPGQRIELEGTSYELTIKNVQSTWPLMTPGFEGASSPMASVDVKCEGKAYNRTVIQRYPELSQDIDEQGVRHREGPYDPNLTLKYRTCADGWITIAAGPDLSEQVAMYNADGSVDIRPLRIGEPRRVVIMGAPLDMTIRSLVRNAETVMTPVVEPLERRRPNIAARSMSAVRLQLTPTGGDANQSITQWAMFSQYPHTEANPIHVKVPGIPGEYEIIYSRLERPLGARLIPQKLSVKFFPGRRNVESWRSDFFVQANADTAPEPSAVYTNQTCTAGAWTLFQSGAAGDHWSYTILGVGNRRGIWTMLLGCTLVTLGSMYAFYVKPILIKRRADAGRNAVGMTLHDEAPRPLQGELGDGGYEEESSVNEEPAEVRA